MKNRNIVFTTTVVLGCLALGALAPLAQGVLPPPDGGYPGFTTAEGTKALQNLTSGAGNTGVGWYSLFSDTAGNFNTGVGAGTLILNTADNNTAVGAAALLLNTTGVSNTALGSTSLVHNDTGGNNTALGAGALTSNTTGSFNTATGVAALISNTNGGANTATGVFALHDNAAGSNTATGAFALQHNTSGTENTAEGSGALASATTAQANTAVGFQALGSVTDQGFNTAVGWEALGNNTTGHNNVAIGGNAGSSIATASNVICIGANVFGADVSNTAWIGGVFGTTTISGTTQPVIVASNGQLGTMSSSCRFKKEIKPMDKTSESILALKPVTFRYKTDETNTPQFGLIAEEVAQVNRDLVARDKDGAIYSVRYDQVNAMLLNEFLKEHKRVEELECTVQRQEALLAQQQKSFDSRLAGQDKQIETLASGLQKVSAALETRDPVPQVVLNR